MRLAARKSAPTSSMIGLVGVIALLGMASGMVPGTALAQPAPLPNDPRRPSAQIARDLGVTQEQFVACFENVRPAAQGTRPTAERVQSNKTVLLGCLQRANPAITNDGLDTVMDRYRPDGREAQMPAR